MKRWLIACVVVGLLGAPGWAGVVVEMEVRNADSPEKASSEIVYAQGEMMRTDMNATAGESDESVIFRDQTMWFVNHKRKACQKIDKKGVDQLSSQLGAMMKQLEAIPPQQREMMEKMMKGKIPGMKEPPKMRVEVGATEQVGDYPCTIHTLYADGEKMSEVCAADESVGAEIAEAMGAFHAMAEFAQELMKVVQEMPFANMIQMPYQEMDKMGGFPIRTRSFDGNGKVVRETTLKSITRRDVEEELFAIPKGYKVSSLEQEMKKGR